MVLQHARVVPRAADLVRAELAASLAQAERSRVAITPMTDAYADIDVIDVATPNDSHCEIAMAALKAGRSAVLHAKVTRL